MGNLLQEFQPLFERIEAGSAERDLHRVLPHEQLDWGFFWDSGFLALRVPVELGGRGMALEDFYELLTSPSQPLTEHPPGAAFPYFPD